MKKTMQLIILFFTLFVAQGQENKNNMPTPKYPLLFKAIIPVAENAPDWIHKMYSVDPNILEIEKSYTVYYQENEFIKTLHTQNYKHLLKKVYQNHWYKNDGTIEVTSSDEKNNSIQGKQTKNAKNAENATWTPIGPLETYKNGGIQTASEQVNVYSVAQSISNPLIMLSGTETGAVFKSTDKGENWFPVGDALFNDGVTCVEIDPTNSNIFFVGTSNRIYKSTDGGVTWIQVLNVSDLSIYEFAIKPSNNQVIFAAGDKGLYKSVNGGTTWTQVFTDTCWDVKFKTNNAETIFLLKSNPTLKLIEFYKSTNGGGSFVLKSNGWFVPSSTSSIGGARMGVTNADGNKIYVAMLGNVDDYATDLNFIGVYKSDNAGESWSLPYDQNDDGIPNNNTGGPYSEDHWSFSSAGNNGDFDQGIYNLAIDVSDTDPNKFLLGMLNLFKSENGGKTYTNWGGYVCTDCTSHYRHPDHQDILINGNDVFVATDGGIDLYDANLNIVKAINKGINASDNWGFGQGWNEDVVTCGRYHNGNGVYHENYGNGKFISLGGGESATGYVNLGDNFKVYHSDIDGCEITSDFSTLNTSIPNLALFPNEAYFTSKKSEVEYDPIYYNHLYLGKENKLWKSEDGGISFNLIKAFGTSITDIVTGIEISRQDPNIIFVAQRVGSVSRLWRSQNGGVNWIQVTLPVSQETMYISLNENNKLFIAFGSDKVYKSNNLGNTWTNLSTAIIASQDISGLIAQMGTNDGVYITMSGNNNIYYRNAAHSDWQLYNHGLPVNTRFVGVLPFYKNGELRISGSRGFWKTPLFEVSAPVAQPIVANKRIDCHRTQVQFDDYSILNHTDARWTWNFPGAATVSSNTVRNPLVTYTNPGSYSVTLTITDGNGNTNSKTINNMIEVLPSTCAIESVALQVLELNDSSQAIVSNDLSYGSTPNLTFTGWIKPNGIQSDWTGIICLGSDDKTLLGFNSNNQLQFHLHGQFWELDTELYAVADQWNFISIRITPIQVTIFLNDKKWVHNGAFSAINLNQIILGKDYDSNDHTFNGQLEEFTIWNRALTDNEIYLSRHLIKETVTDANLIAYYQFNNIQNLGFVYDKKNANDLSISSSILFPSSTAPVGVGTSQLMTINSSGNYNFNNAFASLNFASTFPNGKVVVSKLNVAPHNIPATNIIANEYWILNNYGSNLTFTGLNTETLQSLTNVSSLTPSNVSMYKRDSNGYLQSDWLQNATASSVLANTIQFPGSGLNQSYQWFVGSNTPLGIDEIVPNANIMLYPNPYIQGQLLTIKGMDLNNFRFSLFGMNGELIFNKKLESNEIIIEENLASGFYFYRIETEDKIFNGKIIIK
ncbi:LamG-like jellyroll fold domain-containing protein [Flavobacterium sp. T12S277]|uniref:LamG-like jellyroll fold domain-containing protein n=1 Tax=Flavobacterium sp. T12S277 TaxID=3402752 RepID=UPI003ADAB21A